MAELAIETPAGLIGMIGLAETAELTELAAMMELVGMPAQPSELLIEMLAAHLEVSAGLAELMAGIPAEAQ